MVERYGEFTRKEKETIAWRCTHLKARFVQFKSDRIPPEMRDGLKLDCAKLNLAVGAYWNDRNRLKAMHDIKDRLHRSKVTAYTIKWLLHHSPVYCTYTMSQITAFSEDAQNLLSNINAIFAVQFLFFALDELNADDFRASGRYAGILRDLLYYMATDQYSEKMASLLFDALIIGSSKA